MSALTWGCEVLDFWVPGPPYTKGSVDCMPNGFVKQSDASYDYANRVQAAATAEVERVGWEMASGPVRVTLRFFLPPPGTLERVGAGGMLTWPIGRGEGDIDKLERNVFDPLDHGHARVYRDDSQVVQVWAEKFYARTDVRSDRRAAGLPVAPTGVGTHVVVFPAELMRGERFDAELAAAGAVRRWRALDGSPTPKGM
jgi:Holliday junction resolvase RusA-like endonuclease